jgi:hypothetical protein
MRKKVPCPIYEAANEIRMTANSFRYPLNARNPAAMRTLSPSKKVRINIAM